MVSKTDTKRLKMLIEERDRLIASIRNIEEAS